MKEQEKIRITITEKENGLQIQAEGCVDEMDVLKRMVVSAAKIIADMIREDLSAEERKKAAEGLGNILAEEVTEILLVMLEREKMKWHMKNIGGNFWPDGRRWRSPMQGISCWRPL